MLEQELITPATEQYEAVAELMEHSDYLRVSERAASKVINRDLSPWMPTSLEREVVYATLLRRRLWEWDKKPSDTAKENIGIAFRRLARCENLHLWSKLMILRAQNVVDGHFNIGWISPVREGLDLRWFFFVGGMDPRRSITVNDLKELYLKQVDWRTSKGFDLLAAAEFIFTFGLLNTIKTAEDSRLEILTRPMNLEIDDAAGNPIKSRVLEDLVKEERERVRHETDNE